MKNRGFLFLGGALLLGSGLGIAACGDDTSTGGAGATTGTGTGNPTATGTGNPTTGTGTGTGTGTTTSTGTSTSSGPPANFDCTPSDGSPVTLARDTVQSGFNSPILVKSAPDDPDRLYVVQQDGHVKIIENGQTLGTDFIDVSGLVDFDGAEQGLLGMAFHPDYATNGRFFLHYSSQADGDDSTIQEFHRSTNDPHVADPDPVQLVLQEPTAQGNHNGGATEFGNDGYLYINLGDGGNQGDPECDAQHTDNLLGKIMRIDVNGTPDANGYPAAPGNPDGAKYYHIGFRNPWRSSFDGCTGDLYIGDVGQNMYEEVNHITPADGPKNFGWPYREGAHNYSTPGTCPAQPADLYEPFFDYSHGSGDGCAVVGGYVYRSSASPGLRGSYFFSDNCSGIIWRAVPDGSGGFTVGKENGISGGNVSSFGQDGRGNVYVVTLGGDIDQITAN